MKNFLSIFFLILTMFTSKAFSWGSVTGTHQFINQTAYNLLKANEPAFDQASFPTLLDINKREGFGKDPQDNVTGPDTPKASNFTEHYYNPITEDGDGPSSVYEQYVLFNSNKVKDIDSFSTAKAAAWSAHYIADMTVPYHVIGTTDEKIRNIYKAFKDNKEVILLSEDITGSVSDLRVNQKVPADYRDLIVKYFAENKNDKNTQFFDPWYWNASGFSLSSHLYWEGMKVTSENAPTTLKYDSFWKNPRETSFIDPWALNEEMIKNYVVGIAKKTRKEISNRINNANSGRDEAIVAVSTLWRASISALTPSLEILPVSGTENNIQFIVVGHLQNKSLETTKKVEIKLTMEGATIDEGPEGIIQLEDIPAGERSTEVLTWKITVNNPLNAKLNLEAVGLYSKTPDLQYNVYHYDFKSALDSLSGITSFRFNFDVIFDNGERTELQTTNFGNGTPIGLQADGVTFSIHGSEGTQTLDVVAKLSSDGGKLSKVELNNTSHDELDYLKFSSDVKVVLENLPIKYSYHLGGGIYAYAFWATPKEIEEYVTFSEYNGEGQYSDVDEEGDQVWKNFTMKTKSTQWGTSIIYFEFVNKTPEAIKAIIGSGKLTQEEFNKNLVTWQTIVNSFLQ